MNKKTIIGIIIVVVVAVVWWMYASKPAAAPTTATAPNPTVADNSFTQELNGLNEASVTEEFQAIDAGINNL